MREFDSPGLRPLRETLQTSGGPPQFVDLQDELVQQTIDVMPTVRRGNAPGSLGGVFTASILNTHVGTDIITTDVNPRTPGTTFVGNGYPAAVPINLDVWLLDAFAITETGAGDFAGGALSLIYDATAMGWRNEASGIAVVQKLMTMDQEVSVNGVNHLRMTVSGAIFLNQMAGKSRIVGPASDVRLRWRSRKAGVGAATYKVFLTLGLFPTTTGQDVK